MAEYKIVKSISGKNLEREVFNFSHYEDRNNYRFKEFMNELRKDKVAKRNATYYVFVAKIDKKTDSLQMKKIYGVSKENSTTNLPRYILKQNGLI